MKRFLACVLLGLFATSVIGQEVETAEAATEAAKPDTRMNPELLWKLGRLSGTVLSPDGKTIVYGVRRYDLKENSGTTTVYAQEVGSDKSRILLDGWKSVGDLQFAPSQFGDRIYFSGKRSEAEDEYNQAWSMNPVDGGVVRLTNVEEGIANLKVSPTGDHLAFTRDIKLDDEITETYEDLPKADARIIESLMYRHWNAWHDYKYSHLHVAKIGENGRADEAKDLMADMRTDCPVPPFGGSEQFAWSPDGKSIAYTAKIVERWPNRLIARST